MLYGKKLSLVAFKLFFKTVPCWLCFESLSLFCDNVPCMDSRAGNLLIRSSLISLKSNERLWAICSDWSNQMSNANLSESLISLTKNERPCAICSGRSEEMSDVSELLISLTKNKRMSETLIFLSESLIRSFLDKKQAIRSEIKWAYSQPWSFPSYRCF